MLVDDAPLFRAMVAVVLAPHARVREASAVDAAVALIEERVPDLVILDVRLPPTQTVEGLEPRWICEAGGTVCRCFSCRSVSRCTISTCCSATSPRASDTC